MATTLIEYKRSPAAKAWLKRELAEQQKRYREISQRMNVERAPVWEKAYADFLERIQVRGYSVTGDVLQKIPAAEIPRKPRRKSRVVY
jgi:hypothetical protein